MGRVIHTEIMINAPASKVWQVMMDFDAFPDWNPFLLRISGEQALGGKLKVLLASGDKPMEITPEIISFEPEKELRWKGGVALLFTGKHHFRLTEKTPGITHFVHGEEFSGLMIPLMASMIDTAESGFAAMNEALKARCENGV